MYQLELDLGQSQTADSERVYIAVAVGLDFVRWLQDGVFPAVSDAFVRGCRYDWEPLVEGHGLPAPGESYGFLRVLGFSTCEEASLVAELAADAEAANDYDIRAYDISGHVRSALERRGATQETQP
jgi:pimeloyl-ACP methyl ester carboxylesterase